MWKITLSLLFVLLLLSGCEQPDSGNPVPLGDYAALEKLASAYREMTDQYPVQPRMMPPAGRKEFLDRVFQSAGYDYAATLKEMAEAGPDPRNQDHRDLADLLLLPHKGLNPDDKQQLYTAEEWVSVLAIESALR